MPYFNKINKYKFSENRYSEIDACKKLIDILSKHGVKCWIDFGTLLGFYRDKSIISHDIDIDVSCLVCDNEYSKSWEMLAYLQDDFYIKHYIENSYIAIVPKKYTFNLYQIDIHLHHVENKDIICPTFPDLKSRHLFVDEIEYLNLFNYDFPVPRHLDLYLSIKYGNDWDIKKKNASASKNFEIKNEFVCYITMVGDLFHKGHYNILKHCNNIFDRVIVGVHSDEQILSYKNTQIYDTYETRIKNIHNTGLCHKIIDKATPFVTDKIMDELGADFLVAGREDPEKLKKVYLMDPKKMHLVERTPGISSSDLRINN